MYTVFHTSPKGASIGNTYYLIDNVEKALIKLARNHIKARAILDKTGEEIGRVFYDETKNKYGYYLRMQE
jgi:hypothetical protein